jgi:RND family efflux transporter MFP subunit
MDFRKLALPMWLTACLGMLTAACGLFPEDEEKAMPRLPEPPRISSSITYPVEKEDVLELIEGTARATPTKMQSLYFLVSGRIQSMGAEPNLQVMAGEVLAKLEIDDLEHQLALARLDRDIGRANQGRLNAAGVPAAELRIQELVVAKQQINVEYLEKRVESASIRAPFDGIIQRVQAKVSDLIREYEPIVEIADPSVLELQMNVSENEYQEVEVSMEAAVELRNGLWTPARIIQTTHRNPQVDATVRREEFVVHLELIEPSVQLTRFDRMPGRIIITRREGTLTIPAAGLREFSARTYVRVLEGEIRREVDVKIGIRTETKVEILEGLNEGELVIGK